MAEEKEERFENYTGCEIRVAREDGSVAVFASLGECRIESQPCLIGQHAGLPLHSQLDTEVIIGLPPEKEGVRYIVPPRIFTTNLSSFPRPRRADLVKVDERLWIRTKEGVVTGVKGFVTSRNSL